MAVYDRWHRSYPGDDAEPCKCGRGRNKLYPTAAHGKGKRWQVRWDVIENGKRRQLKKNFDERYGDDPERHAEAFDAKVNADLDADRYVDPANGRTKLKDYAANWRASLLHRDSTEERMERVFRLHVDPFLGEIPIAKVKPSHIRAWVKDRANELAPSTLAVAYSNLAAMFQAAVVDRDISFSPCAGVRLPDVDKHPHFIPTPEQVHAVAGKLPDRYSAIAYVAAGCGLRGGEIFGLEIDAIDFLRREIDVYQQLKVVSGRKPYLAPPKTKTSTRTVEMPKITANALARHIERYPPIEVEIVDETDPRNPRTRTAKLVFLWAGVKGTSEQGDLGPIHRASWSHAWRPAATEAGFPARVGLHCLRHYFATLLIHNGASVKTVQMALGHSTPMITLNEYVGEWPEAQERTRTIVDTALGDVPSKCPPRPLTARSAR